MGTECRYGVMTAMALPSAARRRAMWCRRPRGPRLPPHRLVLPSAGSSSLLSCTRSIRRRCSPGAFAGGHLPELLLLASTRSWCRHLPRPLPRASGSAPQSGSAAPGLPPPRHSGSAAPRLPPPRHSGSAAPRLPPPRHSGSASLRLPSQDQQAPRFIFDDMPEPYFSDSELRVSSGEEEETFDVCLNIDDITVEDERIPCWSPHDSDYSRSDSAKSDSLSSEDLKAIAKEQVRELIKKVDMKKREEKEKERKRERDKRKEKEEERKRERRKGREERKKKERKREREKRKEKIEEEREEEDRKRKKRKGKEEEERKRKGKREKRKREEETKMEKRRHKGGR